MRAFAPRAWVVALAVLAGCADPPAPPPAEPTPAPAAKSTPAVQVEPTPPPAAPPSPSASPLPVLPFDAQLTRASYLFEEPKPRYDGYPLPVGLLVKVTALGETTTWLGQTGRLAQIQAWPSNTRWFFLPHARPIDPGLFINVPKANRLLHRDTGDGSEGCAPWTARLMTGDKAPKLVVWSTSTDAFCGGRLAAFVPDGEGWRRLSLHRGRSIRWLQHRASGVGEPLWDLLESFSEPRKGAPDAPVQRRLLFRLGDAGFEKLLEVETLRDEERGKKKQSMSGNLSVTPRPEGLVISLTGAHVEMDLGTARELSRKTFSRRWVFDGTTLREEK